MNCRSEIESSFQASSRGKLTPEGMKADALQFALNDLLPGLDRAVQTITSAKAELGERKAKVNHQQRDNGFHHDFPEIDELEEAIAAAESAVEAAREEVRVEAGVLNERDLAVSAAPWQ
jgi:hypothetical protein